MATIRISVAEAARDFANLIDRVREGEEIVVESNNSPVAIISPATKKPGRLLSESLRTAQERGCTATLDEGFAADVEAGVASHREEFLTNPWDV